jgi:hypothetical protein
MFFEYLPVFKGNEHIATKNHMESFEYFVDNFKIMHEDVILRLFSKSLVEDGYFCFRNMKACSICSWTDFHRVFLRYWGKIKYVDQCISKFYSLKKRTNETVTHFNWRFHIFYLSMYDCI